MRHHKVRRSNPHRKRLPPHAKLPESRDPATVLAYLEAEFARGESLSRDKPIAELRKLKPHAPKRVEYGKTHIHQVEAVRHRTSLKWSPDNQLKRCNQCKRVAVRGADVCWFHGGKNIVAERDYAKGLKPLLRNDAIRRVKIKARLGQMLPPELEALLNHIKGQIKGTEAQPRRWLIQRETILAWHARADGRFEPWADLLQKFQKIGINLPTN